MTDKEMARLIGCSERDLQIARQLHSILDHDAVLKALWEPKIIDGTMQPEDILAQITAAQEGRA